MLNVEKIGSHISKLRKEKNLTQLELANLVNVSHQAVSKWERGESLPDIGTLILLSKVFGVKIDDLLLNPSKERFSLNKKYNVIIPTFDLDYVLELIRTDQIDMEDIVDISPIIKPSMLNEFVLSLDTSSTPINQIIQFAPFIDQNTLEAVVDKYDSEQLSMDNIVALAPFISKETFISICDKIKGNNSTDGQDNIKNLIECITIAPYHMEQELKELVTKGNELSWETIVKILPFIENEKVFTLIKEKIKSDSKPLDKHIFIQIVPFLTMEQTQEFFLNNLIEFNDVSEVLMFIPFIDSKTLEYLMKKFNNQ